MSAKIIDGRVVSKTLRKGYATRVEALKAKGGRAPGLAVILVGDSAASQIYVRNKIRACHEVGIGSVLIELPTNSTEQEVLDRIDQLNADRAIDGILIQLPLPAQIRMPPVLERISVDKDVDGFHLYNVGGLITGNTVFPPCTPYGVQKLLESENIEVAGRNVVVVGASNIVGKPMAMMLMQQDATVCICHKLTRDLAQFTILADILVVAIGRTECVKGDWIKPGATVIDVGINRIPTPDGKGRLVGDVDYLAASKVAGAITPVPGGVGPMTIACLMVNTLKAACQQHGIKDVTIPLRLLPKA